MANLTTWADKFGEGFADELARMETRLNKWTLLILKISAGT